MKIASRHIGAVAAFLCALVTVVLIASCASDETRQQTPLRPEEAFAKAEKLIDNFEYEEARRILGEVKNNDSTGRYAAIARLKIAESYAEEENYESAVAEYRRFIDSYPDSQYAPYAQYQIAMLYFSRIRGPERGAGEAKLALKEFRKLKELFPRNPYKEIVDINIKKCLHIIAEYEFIVGEFYFKKGSYRAALGRFLGLLERFPDYDSADRVLYFIALSYLYSGDEARANQYLDTLRARFPDSEYTVRLADELDGGH